MGHSVLGHLYIFKDVGQLKNLAVRLEHEQVDDAHIGKGFHGLRHVVAFEVNRAGVDFFRVLLGRIIRINEQPVCRPFVDPQDQGVFLVRAGVAAEGQPFLGQEGRHQVWGLIPLAEYFDSLSQPQVAGFAAGGIIKIRVIEEYISRPQFGHIYHPFYLL